MANESKRLTRTHLPVFGFGYFRLSEGKPWFAFREYVETVGNMPGVRYGNSPAISRSGFVQLTAQFVELGFLERREAPSEQRHKGNMTRVQIKTTLAGTEAMLDTIVYRVTHEGETVPEMLIHPVIGALVLETTDLKNRIIVAVSQLTPSQGRFWGTDKQG
jgi:hypothetical protein